MTISGYECWKRKGLSRRRKLENVGAETTSWGLLVLLEVQLSRSKSGSSWSNSDTSVCLILLSLGEGLYSLQCFMHSDHNVTPRASGSVAATNTMSHLQADCFAVDIEPPDSGSGSGHTRDNRWNIHGETVYERLSLGCRVRHHFFSCVLRQRDPATVPEIMRTATDLTYRQRVTTPVEIVNAHTTQPNVQAFTHMKLVFIIIIIIIMRGLDGSTCAFQTDRSGKV